MKAFLLYGPGFHVYIWAYELTVSYLYDNQTRVKSFILILAIVFHLAFG